jgi:hypothetical protein
LGGFVSICEAKEVKISDSATGTMAQNETTSYD